METNEDQTVLEGLASERYRAFKEYEALSGPADAAHKRYQSAVKKHREAELYAKIRRQVIRELVSSAKL